MMASRVFEDCVPGSAQCWVQLPVMYRSSGILDAPEDMLAFDISSNCRDMSHFANGGAVQLSSRLTLNALIQRTSRRLRNVAAISRKAFMYAQHNWPGGDGIEAIMQAFLPAILIGVSPDHAMSTPFRPAVDGSQGIGGWPCERALISIWAVTEHDGGRAEGCSARADK
jgi:hypothetical protein